MLTLEEIRALLEEYAKTTPIPVDGIMATIEQWEEENKYRHPHYDE